MTGFGIRRCASARSCVTALLGLQRAMRPSSIIRSCFKMFLVQALAPVTQLESVWCVLRMVRCIDEAPTHQPCVVGSFTPTLAHAAHARIRSATHPPRA